MIEASYLTNIPQDIEKYGFCKVLAVRRELIHIKHIFTEIFVRKTIDIQKYLDTINWTLFEYMEFMTNRLRKVHYFSREYINTLDDIVKNERDNFFPTLELYTGLNNCIVLDFDGVTTETQFKSLYELCIQRSSTYICTANPTVTTEWFNKKEYLLPNKIYACKGKLHKIKQLIEISKKHDYTFYVDNEDVYLEFAWIFGIQTYKYDNKKIKYFSLKTK